MFYNEMSIAPKILNLGYQIIYDPDFKFFHLAAPATRLNQWRVYLFTRNAIWNILRFDPLYIFPFTFLYLNAEMIVKSLKNGCFWNGYVKGFIDGIKKIFEYRFKNNEI